MQNECKSCLEEYHENVNGESLKLVIIKFKDGLEVYVKPRWRRKARRKAVFLLVLLFSALFRALMKWSINGYDYVGTMTAIAVLLSLINTVKHEHLLVVEPVGYQLRTKFVIGESSEFAPWDSVDDVFLHEVISLQRVLYKLSMFADKREKLIPLFPITSPRLKCLVSIYRSLKTFK